MRRSTFLSAVSAVLLAGFLGLAAPSAAHAADGDDLVGGWYALTWTNSPTLYKVAKDGTLTAVGSAPQAFGIAGFDVDATNGRALFPTYNGEGQLWEVDLGTGDFTKVADSNFTDATAFDIGNNGELWIAADNLDGSRGFGKLDSNTGQVTRLAAGPERIAALATAPDGVLWAFGYSNKAYTYSPETNEFTHVEDLNVSILAADFDTDGTVLLQSWDGTLTRYDITTGETTKLFRMSNSVPGFQGEAFSVAGPTDGRTVDEVLNPPAAPAVTVSSGEVTAGDEVTVTGAHFTPDATVRIELDGTALGTATVDDLGAFTYTATIPVSTTAGARTIAAVDTTSNRTVNTPLTVKAAPAVTVSSGEVTAGDEVTVTGAHFTPDATVRIELDGTALGT
ncbi:hypothetical protein NCCP1664_14270, partial [Zafaria cholistanensis]